MVEFVAEMVGSRVYVGGLPYGVRERDLERFFKGYGRTRDILIKNGYGFVVSLKLISRTRRCPEGCLVVLRASSLSVAGI